MLSKTYKEVIRELRIHSFRFVGIEYEESDNKHEFENDSDSKILSYFSNRVLIVT
ncbi:ankyrin repeat protein [Magpiepox virus]|nr:ankyrin repeat protein [Magpiepox virus]